MNKETLIIAYLINLVCFLFGTIYGGIQLLKQSRGKYYLNVFLGYVGFTLGWLYITVYQFIGGEASNFSVGDLGVISGYFFLICANKSLLPQTNDPQANMTKRGKAICLIIPLIEFVIVIGGYIFGLPNSLSWTAATLIIVLTYIPCAYYTMKAIFAPDIKGGFAECMRGANICIVTLTMLSAVAELARLIENDTFYTVYISVITLLSCVCIVAFMPLLERGYRKWTA